MKVIHHLIKVFHRKAISASTKRLFLAFGAALLLVGIILSLADQREILVTLNPFPLLMLFFVTPISILLSAESYRVSGFIAGVRLRRQFALEVCVLGAAASILPLPGGSIARIAGISRAGGTVKGGTFSTAVVFAMWASVISVYSGIFLLFFHSFLFGTVVTGLSSVIAIILFITMVRYSGLYVAVAITLLNVVIAFVEAIRLYLCFTALDHLANFSQASAVAISIPLSAFAAFVPAGLGVREALAALLSPLVDLSPAIGFIAAGLNRLFGLAVILPAAMLLAYFHRRTDPPSTNDSLQ